MPDPLLVTRADRTPTDLEGLWAPNPAFLVGAGPSLDDFPLDRLRERGVMSLAINNAAAKAPVRAWCFSDPQDKFHQAMFLDPSIMTFSPIPKLRRAIKAKTEDGFRFCSLRVRDCPNTFGFSRTTKFVPETFFTDRHAHWGPGKHQPPDKPKIPDSEGKRWGKLVTALLGFRLLHYLGVRRIYLIGVDFKGRDGRLYGFPSRKKIRTRRFRHEGKMLEALLPEFEQRGIEVFNCNADSDCRLFPFASFEEAVADCKGSIPEEPLDTFDWYAKKTVRAECLRHPVFTPRHYEENR
jgi:hypothetical protein